MACLPQTHTGGAVMSMTEPEREPNGSPALSGASAVSGGRGNPVTSPPMPCRRLRGPGSPVFSSRQTLPAYVSRQTVVEPPTRLLPPNSPIAGTRSDGSSVRASMPSLSPPPVSRKLSPVPIRSSAETVAGTRLMYASSTRAPTSSTAQSTVLRRNSTADGPLIPQPAPQLRPAHSAVTLSQSPPAASACAVNVTTSAPSASWIMSPALQSSEATVKSQARVLPRSSCSTSTPQLAPQSPKLHNWKSPIATTRRLRSVSPVATESTIQVMSSPVSCRREGLRAGPQRWSPGYVVKRQVPMRSHQSEHSVSTTLAASSGTGRVTRQSSALTSNFQDDFEIHSQTVSPRTAEPKTRDASPASQILQEDAPEVALLQQQEEPLLRVRRPKDRANESSDCPESVHLSPAYTMPTHRSEPECSTSDDRRPDEVTEEDPRQLVKQQLENIEQALEERMQLREQSQQASIIEKLAQQEQLIQQLQKDTEKRNANSGQLQKGFEPTLKKPVLDGFEDWMERWRHVQQAPQANAEERAIQVELAARSRLEAQELRAEVERVRAQSAEEIAKLRSEVERLQTGNQVNEPLQSSAPEEVNQLLQSSMPEDFATAAPEEAGIASKSRRLGAMLTGLREVTHQVDDLVKDIGRRTIDAATVEPDTVCEYEQVQLLQQELVEREASMVAATEEIVRLRQELDIVRLAGSARFSLDSFAVMERMRRLRAKISPANPSGVTSHMGSN